MKARRVCQVALGALTLFAMPALARAHGFGPAAVLVEQDSETSVRLTWLQRPRTEVAFAVPAGCSPSAGPPAPMPRLTRAASPSVLGGPEGIRCESTVGGRVFAVEGLSPLVPSLIVRFRRSGAEEERTTVVSSDDPQWRCPTGDAWGVVAPVFLSLGFFHILEGPDHLAFVLGLLWLSLGPVCGRQATHGEWRTALARVVRSVTAFTVAHSLTLAASSFGWLAVAPAAAELCIAASLVLVAADIGRSDVAASAPLAFLFGLVHGLGFAGALRAVGLPSGAASSALLAFNLGVELGQLAFLAGCASVLAAALRSLRIDWVRGSRWGAVSSAYLIGTLGASLAIQRARNLSMMWSES